MTADLVAWHEAECHGYDADLPLWLRLAEREPGPVLDVGAGTGRVALALAAAGHEVTALDVEPALLAALRERDPSVATVVADAHAFDLAGFGLVIVPMQTLQLLDDRRAFFANARRALRPGGLLAAAIADELVPFEGTDLPHPDVVERDGRRFVSQPTAVRVGPERARIERLRTVDGVTAADVIELAVVDAAALAVEARAEGLVPVPGERIPATEDHVGSSVVMFRA
jgi:SAM-dependent methyltransferase